jgi:hypothetical protein
MSGINGSADHHAISQDCTNVHIVADGLQHSLSLLFEISAKRYFYSKMKTI